MSDMKGSVEWPSLAGAEASVDRRGTGCAASALGGEKRMQGGGVL